MDIGMVGLGKMGNAMRERLRRAGHTVVGYDRNQRISGVASLAELVRKLPTPRVVWVMVPAGKPTQQIIASLRKLLRDGDVVVDGGNSRYTDDFRHAARLAAHGIGFVDVGVSGGVWGLHQGYALMVGGDPEHVAMVKPAFDTLKPAGEYGYIHAGPVGAGHFAKMAHNAIEYGLMQAYAEGYELLNCTDLVADVPAVIRSWKEGTVIRSWLLDLLASALEQDGDLSRIPDYVEDSGEGRWAVEAAVEAGVALPAISAALFARFSSRQQDSPAMKVVAGLRNQFGGHPLTVDPVILGKGADAPGADVAPPVEADGTS